MIPLAYILTVLAVELTPGPNMGYLAVVSAKQGFAAGLIVVAGVTAGLAAYLLASVLGLTEVLTPWPWTYQVLRWTGVAYLVYLGVEGWRARAEPALADEKPDRAKGALFLRGLAVNLLNPKAALFYVALLPEFTYPARGHIARQILILGAVHLLVSVAIHSSIVAGASQSAGYLSRHIPAGAARGMRGVSAVLLILIAVWVAWQTRR